MPALALASQSYSAVAGHSVASSWPLDRMPSVPKLASYSCCGQLSSWWSSLLHLPDFTAPAALAALAAPVTQTFCLSLKVWNTLESPDRCIPHPHR